MRLSRLILSDATVRMATETNKATVIRSTPVNLLLGHIFYLFLYFTFKGLKGFVLMRL